MFKPIELPYDYDELKPILDEMTVKTHYLKHHGTYTTNLNNLVEKSGIKEQSITELLVHLDQIPDIALRRAIKNNAGGFYNHNLYFEQLSPTARTEPKGVLKDAIEDEFGGFENLKEKMNEAALSQFGSGWAWLYVTIENKLAITCADNQDNPLMNFHGIPILGIDVWEHAYYLQYKNMRADYVKAIWCLIDWEVIEKRYKKALVS